MTRYECSWNKGNSATITCE